MSFKVFFSLSGGIKKSVRVPKGEKKRIAAAIRRVKDALGFKLIRETYKDMHGKKEKRLRWVDEVREDVPDEVLCQEAEDYNAFIRQFYEDLSNWFKHPIKGGEVLTPKQAEKIWPCLEIINVPIERWTREYFKNRMQAIYETLRGRPSEGMEFDAPPLTTEQASEIFPMFDYLLNEEWSDTLRLAVPKGWDSLASSDDGEYEWCEKCGAVDSDDPCEHLREEEEEEDKEEST